jgi:hypothetical protein
MSAISILPDEATWRSRKVRYYAGDWTAILSVLPEFYFLPFSASQDDPANPFLQIVMRKPLSRAERPIHVGVVSHSYILVPHREAAELCRRGLIDSGIEEKDLRYEVGLSELGEWMNFRIYLPKSYRFIDAPGSALDLRLECFNSVDGSSRLVILFGWFRLVCENGLVIGETKIEINERHGQGLDLQSIAERIRPAIEAVETDRDRMEGWKKETIGITKIAAWADGKLSVEWGKKAAARVFHICDVGKDIEFVNLFSPGSATKKPVRYLDRVPGSPERATRKYDVAQTLSFVATHRSNAEERVIWQTDIPVLLHSLE